jgi:ArsR family transcriptional regulator
MDLVLTPVGAAATVAACCTPVTAPAISEPDAIALATSLKALADPARLRLLSIIAAQETGDACVCDLTEPLGLSQPTVSHHLKVLVEAGLLTREKRGVWAHFALVPGALDTITSHLGSHLRSAA